MKSAISEILSTIRTDASALLQAAAVGLDTLQRMPRDAYTLEMSQWQDTVAARFRAISDHAKEIRAQLLTLEEELRLRPRKPYKLKPQKLLEIQKWRTTKKKDRISLTALADELRLSRQSIYTAIKVLQRQERNARR